MIDIPDRAAIRLLDGHTARARHEAGRARSMKLKAAEKKSSPRRSQGRPPRAQAGVGRDALIEFTRRLLQVKPPGKVTREEIARFAGVNPALIRYYFGDKSTLLTAVVEAIPQENLTRLRDTLSQQGTTAERLARRVQLLLQMHIENPYYHQLIFEQLWQGTSREQKRLSRQMIVPYYEEFSRLFAEGRQRNELRDVDPRFVHVAIIGLCELFINAPYMLRDLFQIKEITPDLVRRYGDFVIDVLLRGIGIGNYRQASPRRVIPD